MCQGALTVTFLVMQWDFRGINFYLSQLLSTLWFPWPQRLKVTQWGQCSQHFPHQPRCEFLTFLFVLFLSNIKVPNIVFNAYIVIKGLLNCIHLLCDLSFKNKLFTSIYSRFNTILDNIWSKGRMKESLRLFHIYIRWCFLLPLCVLSEINYLWQRTTVNLPWLEGHQ